MANSIADIYGPSPEELEYQRRKEQEDQARQEYLAKLPGYGSEFGIYGGVARSGLETGNMLRNLRLFGESPSPEMDRATTMKQILSKYQGQDLSDPNVMAQISQELGKQGYPREAMQMMEQARARAASVTSAAREAEKAQLDLEKTRADIEKTRAETQGKGAGDFLKEPELKEFRETAGQINDFKRVNSSAKDEYFRLTRPVLTAAKTAPGATAAVVGLDKKTMQDAVLWWADYDKFLAMVRNKLYGSALTESEIKNFNKAIITEITDPDTARKMLKTQQDLAIKGYKKLVELYKD